MKNHYLFVYGTLRRDVGHAMSGLLDRNASLMGVGAVQGELYSLGEYPGLVPREDTADVVRGELYSIKLDALEHTLSVLDEYEGVGDEDSSTAEYRRELVPVVLNDRRKIRAWAYVVNRSLEGLRRIPNGDFAEWRRSRA